MYIFFQQKFMDSLATHLIEKVADWLPLNDIMKLLRLNKHWHISLNHHMYTILPSIFTPQNMEINLFTATAVSTANVIYCYGVWDLRSRATHSCWNKIINTISREWLSFIDDNFIYIIADDQTHTSFMMNILIRSFRFDTYHRIFHNRERHCWILMLTFPPNCLDLYTPQNSFAHFILDTYYEYLPFIKHVKLSPLLYCKDAEKIDWAFWIRDNYNKSAGAHFVKHCFHIYFGDMPTNSELDDYETKKDFQSCQHLCTWTCEKDINDFFLN